MISSSIIINNHQSSSIIINHHHTNIGYNTDIIITHRIHMAFENLRLFVMFSHIQLAPEAIDVLAAL